VLIAVGQKIDLKTQINMSWDDPEVGQIEGTFYVIREFQKQGGDEKLFYYGVRYYQLETVSKQRLLDLLNRVKSEGKKEAEKISLDTIYGVLDQKEAFFVKALESASSVHPFYKKYLENLKPYEIKAFEAQDNPYTRIIRQYVVLHFQATILKSVVSFVLKKPSRFEAYLSRVNDVLNELEEISTKEDEVFQYIDSVSADDADIAAMKMNYNESTNRSFYGKQAMMEKVIKEMEGLELAPELRAYMNAINERYDRTMELTNPNMQLSDIHTVSKYTPPPISGTGEHMVPPSMGIASGQGIKKYIVLALLLMFLLIRGVLGAVNGWLEKREYADELQLPIAIKSVEKQGQQLSIRVDSDDWDSLNESTEAVVQEKIQSYLMRENRLRICIVRSSVGDVKRIITQLE
jgi:hypothetical protein